MNAPEQRLTIPAIGTALAGGTCRAHVFANAAPFALILPAKAMREHAGIVWHPKRAAAPGANSYFDGLANTMAMAAAGSPLAQWALDQRIDGLADWYIPSRAEALAIRGNTDELPAEEAFEEDWYWTSTQYASGGDWAWQQYFGRYGGQRYDHKSIENRAFVVRRESIR